MARRQGLDKLSYEGLKHTQTQGLEGLSIIYITPFPRAKGKVDKSTNLQIHNWGYHPMHKREGLSNLQNPRGYKRYTNTYIQTISSGYKGLVNMLDIRFDGLMV